MRPLMQPPALAEPMTAPHAPMSNSSAILTSSYRSLFDTQQRLLIEALALSTAPPPAVSSTNFFSPLEQLPSSLQPTVGGFQNIPSPSMNTVRDSLYNNSSFQYPIDPDLHSSLEGAMSVKDDSLIGRKREASRDLKDRRINAGSIAIQVSVPEPVYPARRPISKERKESKKSSSLVPAKMEAAEMTGDKGGQTQSPRKHFWLPGSKIFGKQPDTSPSKSSSSGSKSSGSKPPKKKAKKRIASLFKRRSSSASSLSSVSGGSSASSFSDIFPQLESNASRSFDDVLEE